VTELALPDLPRWVEAHGLAADPTSWRRTLGTGFAVGNDHARLVVVGGDAEAAAVDELARAYDAHALLVAIEREDLAATLRAGGRPVVRAVLHTLSEPDALPELEGAFPLPEHATLSHLPPALADGLRHGAYAKLTGSPTSCPPRGRSTRSGPHGSMASP